MRSISVKELRDSILPKITMVIMLNSQLNTNKNFASSYYHNNISKIYNDNNNNDTNNAVHTTQA